MRELGLHLQCRGGGHAWGGWLVGWLVGGWLGWLGWLVGWLGVVGLVGYADLIVGWTVGGWWLAVWFGWLVTQTSHRISKDPGN